MRARFLKNPDSFADHELIELLLFYCIPRRNTNETAHDLLKASGSIGGLLSSETADFCKTDGIGKGSAQFLRFIADICCSDDNMGQQRRCFNALSDILRDSPPDMCIVMSPGSNGLIRFSLADVIKNEPQMTELVSSIMRREWCEIIIAVNHTGRDVIPAKEDIRLFRLLQKRLSALTVELLDFLLIDGGSVFSLITNEIILDG